MNFKTLACTVFDERAGEQPETNMPRNFCEVGGIKKSVNIKDEFIFLRFMEVWTQRVPCKVNVTPFGVTYFARDTLRSYFHEPQKNEIHFLNELTA